MDQITRTRPLRPIRGIGTWIAPFSSVCQTACLLAAVLLVGVSTAMADGNLVVKKSPRSVSETLDRFTELLKARGISVVARVDHAAGAAKAGMSLRPTTLLIFGNPKLGTPLMLENPKAGLDLPMKVLAWQDEGGQVWLAYANPERLKADHGLKSQDATLQQMAKALSSLTDEAIRAK